MSLVSLSSRPWSQQNEPSRAIGLAFITSTAILSPVLQCRTCPSNASTPISYIALVSGGQQCCSRSAALRNNAGRHGFPPARGQWRPRGTTPRTPERNNTNEARRGRAPHPAAVAARVARDGRGDALPRARGARPGRHAPPLRANGRRHFGHERVARRAAPALLGGLRRARARGRRVAVLHGGARLRVQLGGREAVHRSWPPRHRRDTCSTAWRCRCLSA